jgi:hypothetical protein
VIVIWIIDLDVLNKFILSNYIRCIEPRKKSDHDKIYIHIY